VKGNVPAIWPWQLLLLDCTELQAFCWSASVNSDMMGTMVFGKGKSLRQHSKYLRQPAERRKRIVDVTERNSVIEGLPRLTPRRRADLLRKLRTA
jgi:hypothetical protein